MRQAERGTHNTLNTVSNPFGVRFLACLLLISVLLPTRPVSAQQEINPTILETEGLLIYKSFGDPVPATQPLPAPCSGEDCNLGATDYYKPFTSFITTTSNPSPVDNPSLWPYATTVKLLSHWPSGETSACSGTLMEAKYVVTAAHCIYTHNPDTCSDGDSSCWVDDLEALPAYQNGEAPAGRSGYETILTWTDWTTNQMAEYDLAAIKLRYPLGAQVGWLGAGFYADDTFFTNNTFALSGYPEASPFNGEDMAFWSGQVSIADSSEDLLHLNGSFDSGWDGATLNADHGVAYAVISSVNPTAGVTLTRITYDKFDAIRTFIQEGQPKEDGGNLTTFFVQANPEWNFPGQPLTGMNFILWNYSNSPLPHAAYPVDIYLSTDNRITTTDTYLGTYTHEGAFEANQGVRISLDQSLSLPEELHGSEPCGGIFYIGTIVDYSDANPHDNHSDFFQPESVWVFDSDNFNYIHPIWYK